MKRSPPPPTYTHAFFIFVCGNIVQPKKYNLQTSFAVVDPEILIYFYVILLVKAHNGIVSPSLIMTISIIHLQKFDNDY